MTHRHEPSPSRREVLQWAQGGLCGLASAAMLPRMAGAQDGVDPLTGPHHLPRAKNVIFLYMDGGVSQVDSFDPKPRLDRDHGKPLDMRAPDTQFAASGTVLRSPWAFKQYGQSGTPVSDLFPHIAGHVDRMSVIRSMVANFSEHTQANYFLHTGSGQQGRPSMGAWANFGLGAESSDLPGFVVLNGGLIPVGGLDNLGSGFLPATYQGSIFANGPAPLANLTPPDEPVLGPQGARLGLLERLNRRRLERVGGPEVQAALENYDLARRMQRSVPELMCTDEESEATRRMYGLESAYEPTRVYGGMCLAARRLVERGVRFIELTSPEVGHDRWDQHSNLENGHADNARAVDQPIGALLTDLEQRGLLDETLVVWSGEFGRTPMAQGLDGRDHNPFGFSLWMAGGGVKSGHIHGETDEFGYFAVRDKVTVHDLHATMLHLLGVDHTRLTYRFSGRDMRLTDVHGEVVQDVLA